MRFVSSLAFVVCTLIVARDAYAQNAGGSLEGKPTGVSSRSTIP